MTRPVHGGGAPGPAPASARGKWRVSMPGNTTLVSGGRQAPSANARRRVKSELKQATAASPRSENDVGIPASTRIARAKRDPPDDIIEQMRNEAQFLNDRAVDQRNVADAAEPLFTSLDDKQKTVFIQEMVNLSHERGLD